MKAWMKTWAVLCLAVLAGWPMAAPAQNTHTLPLVRPAGFAGQESLVRVVNRSATSGTVQITAFDDDGERFGPVTLALGARETVTITSRTLESGSAGIGLPVGIGDGRGSWRLELATALTIDPLTYIRTPDKFMTSMHDVAPVVDGSHWVPFFNPGSNTSKVSHLRIVNPGATAAEVTVTGRDDAGDEASGTVRLTLPAGAARTLTAQALEAGGEGFDGSLGDSAGKWTLNVSSTADIQVMSLLATTTGHLANLSTVPSIADGGGTPPPPPPPPPPPGTPDLVVESPSVSDSSLNAGVTFTLGARVRNQGGGPSAATTLRYYRSSDATISRSDTGVGTDTVGSLSASGASGESISLTAPASAGTYYYGACVDPVAEETNTANNCSASSGTHESAAAVSAVGVGAGAGGGCCGCEGRGAVGASRRVSRVPRGGSSMIRRRRIPARQGGQPGRLACSMPA